MNNPMDFLKMFSGLNPQQIAMRMIGGNNPIFSNLMNMAQKGDTKGVENFARNFCKERGVDFDKEFGSFMNNVK